MTNNKFRLSRLMCATAYKMEDEEVVLQSLEDMIILANGGGQEWKDNW